eukprot:5299762-Lingulodinium_polyedra.AAC.1
MLFGAGAGRDRRAAPSPLTGVSSARPAAAFCRSWAGAAFCAQAAEQSSRRSGAVGSAFGPSDGR